MTGRPLLSTTNDRTKIPEGRRKLWQAMRISKRFSLEELMLITDCSYPNTRRYVRRLLGAGYLRLLHEAKGAGEENTYLLIRNSGPKPPIPRKNTQTVYDENTGETHTEAFGETARDRAWKLIREGHAFSLEDLKAEGLQQANAYKYLACLLEAGVIAQTRATKPGPGGWPANYQLIHDLGPLAPVEQRNGGLFDPNSQSESEEKAG